MGTSRVVSSSQQAARAWMASSDVVVSLNTRTFSPRATLASTISSRSSILPHGSSRPVPSAPAAARASTPCLRSSSCISFHAAASFTRPPADRAFSVRFAAFFSALAAAFGSAGGASSAAAAAPSSGPAPSSAPLPPPPPPSSSSSSAAASSSVAPVAPMVPIASSVSRSSASCCDSCAPDTTSCSSFFWAFSAASPESVRLSRAATMKLKSTSGALLITRCGGRGTRGGASREFTVVGGSRCFRREEELHAGRSAAHVRRELHEERLPLPGDVVEVLVEDLEQPALQRRRADREEVLALLRQLVLQHGRAEALHEVV